MNRLLRRLARHEGFTLAELLIVVAVVGILLAIAVPPYLGFTKKASDTAGAANARSTSVTRLARRRSEAPLRPHRAGLRPPRRPTPGSTARIDLPERHASDRTGQPTTAPGDVTTQPGPGRVRVQRPAPLPSHGRGPFTDRGYDAHRRRRYKEE